MRGQIKTGGDEKREIPRMRLTENSEERKEEQEGRQPVSCLLYTSDAADE